MQLTVHRNVSHEFMQAFEQDVARPAVRRPKAHLACGNSPRPEPRSVVRDIARGFDLVQSGSRTVRLKVAAPKSECAWQLQILSSPYGVVSTMCPLVAVLETSMLCALASSTKTASQRRSTAPSCQRLVVKDEYARDKQD